MESVPKIKAFQSVDNLIHKLSETEVTNFRSWRFDGYRWISFSDYYYFGSVIQGNDQKNNIAYYISSAVESYIQDLKIILNINNRQEEQNAINTFIRITLKTYGVLSVTPPQNLLASIVTGSEWEYEDEIHFTKIKIVKAHIPSWRVIIESK